MKNLYYNQIIEILTNNPEGVKVNNISRQLYNSHCSLFETDDLYKSIYESTRRFLWKQSKSPSSPFCKVDGKWGVYALRKSFVIQLELCFDNWEYDVVQHKKPKEEESSSYPNLFGW